ncbi:hypothetical protein [Geodermatophilus sp. CPCC 206100]|uniref:hypothetical protein n=1 Tax=Geodermatophilus sp. CPCC 206100 TaxID=3020054 RepID=UPI003AFFA7E3
MDRRLPLLALVLFVVLTGASIAVSGSRPGLDQGTLPWLLQVIGHLFALAAGVLLAAHGDGGQRRTGFVVLAAVVVLALLDAAVLASDEGGANIGAGFVRLLLLLVLCAATARVARDVVAARRPR